MSSVPVSYPQKRGPAEKTREQPLEMGASEARVPSSGALRLEIPLFRVYSKPSGFRVSGLGFFPDTPKKGLSAEMLFGTWTRHLAGRIRFGVDIGSRL